MAHNRIIILGAGPAGLIAAGILSAQHEVLIYDKEKNIGQKLLVAGKGGLNITNSAAPDVLIAKYSPPGFLDECLNRFNPSAFREWLSDLGIPTFIGSSGKVFPEKGIMAKVLLSGMRTRLLNQGVTFNMLHKFVGFDEKRKPCVKANGQVYPLTADYYIFAFGGASWPQTGSDGNWRTIFESGGIRTIPLTPSNCGVGINWPDSIRQPHSGKPLKNIKISFNSYESKGEALITESGLEGSAIYPLVPWIRKQLVISPSALLNIDFKPFNTNEQLLIKLQGRAITSKDYSDTFNLSPVQIALLKAYTSKEEYLSPPEFIKKLKCLTVPVSSLRPVDEAISTVGGVRTDELNTDFSIKQYPHLYTIGEMVDWDAPTGGFLLQACFSMANQASASILEKLAREGNGSASST